LGLLVVGSSVVVDDLGSVAWDGLFQAAAERSDSVHRGGRSRQWRKAKHNVDTLQVAGWRPSASGGPGGVLLADDGDWVGWGQ
jgi:hypothetical protein